LLSRILFFQGCVTKKNERKLVMKKLVINLISIFIGVAGTHALATPNLNVSTDGFDFVAPSIYGVTNVSSPQAGLIVYDTEDNTFKGKSATSANGWEILSPTQSVYAVVSKTSNYTLVSSDEVVLADATSTAFTLTLPAGGSNTGKSYFIKKSDSSANIVTISGTIDGGSQYLGAQNDSITVVDNGTSYSVIQYTYKKQQVIGSAMTSNASTTSASYAALSTSTTVSITPLRSGTYRISGTYNVTNSTANQNCFLRIVASSGSPTVLFTQDAEGTPSSGQILSLSPYSLVTLSANTAYTFRVEGKTSGGTLELRGDLVPSGVVLVAQEI
jgi:hypothetical protein